MIAHLGRGSFTVPASSGDVEHSSYAGYAVLISGGVLCVWRSEEPGNRARSKRLAVTLTEETAPLRADIIYGPAGWRNFRREPRPE